MRYIPHVVLGAGLALVTCSVLGCAGAPRPDPRAAHAFTMAQVRDPAAGPRLRAAMQGEGVVLRMRRGETLPVRLTSRLGVAHLAVADGKGSSPELVLDRDVWIYIAPRRALISPDGQRWARLGDWKTMRRLFGLRGGSFQVGLGVSAARGAELTLAFDARR